VDEELDVSEEVEEPKPKAKAPARGKKRVIETDDSDE
jgi:hypothetical protein